MNDSAILEGYGALVDANTLRIQRLLPGPIERVWEYLTKSELRRKWFAAGDMQMEVDAPFEFVWRNDELTDPPGERPPGSSGENRMQTRILDLDPPRRIAFAWGANSSVSFDLEERQKDVLLTIVHKNVPDRASLLNFGPGWHAHLDVLLSLLTSRRPEPFWDEIRRLKLAYAQRWPA